MLTFKPNSNSLTKQYHKSSTAGFPILPVAYAFIQYFLNLKNVFFWCDPFGYLYFFIFLQSTRIECIYLSILAWLWPHYHLVYWMRRDSNPQPIDRVSNSLTTRPDRCPIHTAVINIICLCLAFI